MNAGSMFVPIITRKGKYSTINNIVFDPTDTKRLCSYITALRRYSQYSIADHKLSNQPIDILKVDGWLFQLTPPSVYGMAYSNPMNPTDRCNAHYGSDEQFDLEYFDTEIADVLYPTRFTLNTINTNRVNMNTLLHDVCVSTDPTWPLYKYNHFNVDAANV